MSKDHTQYGKFFGRLKCVSGRTGQWSALCPAHEDTKASLSVSVGADGKLLFQCHAPCRCPKEKILEAMGLGWGDCFPTRGSSMQSGQQPERKMVKTYDYRDENAVLVYQVCRYEPKGFTQRRVNPAYNPKMPIDRETNPQFIYNMDGVRRVLYRLPELMRDIKANPKRMVFIVEGEKDVDLMRDNQIVSTTMPGGALKWDTSYNEFFRGCNVCVIADNDPVDSSIGFSPGKRHAEMVAKSLTGIAAQVVALELPNLGPKGDFADWWQNNGHLAPDERKKTLGALVLEKMNAVKQTQATTSDAGTSQPADTKPQAQQPTPAPTTTPEIQQPAPQPTLPVASQQAEPQKVPSTEVAGTTPSRAESLMIDFGASLDQMLSRGFPTVPSIYDAIGRLQIKLDSLKLLTMQRNTTALDQMRASLLEIASIAVISANDVPGMK